MAKEVEIRAVVENPESIVRTLINMGFAKKARISQKDIMLDNPDGNLFKSGQKIRIRIEGEHAELTYKGHFEGNKDASRRTEVSMKLIPTEVDSAISIFHALGYPVLFTVPKDRECFDRDGIKVTIDNWPIIGWLVEIEGEEGRIRDLASEIAPGVEFSNFRLKELFERKERESGLTLATLKAQYEAKSGNALGNIEFLLA